MNATNEREAVERYHVVPNPINLDQGNMDRCTIRVRNTWFSGCIHTCKGVNIEREREREGQMADLVSYRI